MSAADPVVLVRAVDLRLAAGQTPGMTRKEAFADANVWVGLVTTEPVMASGWHHHAAYDTYIHVVDGRLRMESGVDGVDVVDADTSDFIRVPPGAIHRESNPDPTPARIVIVRVGSRVPVVNVEGPAQEEDVPT